MKNIWVADTGATHHVCIQERGLMFDKGKTEEEHVVIGDGTRHKIQDFGTYQGFIHQSTGEMKK